MYELANPTISSLFLCGDINQRLTSWGLKSNEALDWIGSGIQRKSITVSYRQSQRLVDLAKQVATIGGSQVDDIILPDRLDVEGVAPVWKTQLTNNAEKAEWLTQRIHEIDRMVQKATTIAVLVNEEEDVEALALELNDRLEEISLSAVACKDGKVVGNDRDVRVFDIRHIKGLEFEAVFFMDLDQTITQHPELFSKYLYVGATRAASYLGVTFCGDVPPQVVPLGRHFGQDWSM
jgi:DNA helicase IV